MTNRHERSVGAAHARELGSLGFVCLVIPDEPEQLSLRMVGRQYQLVWAKIEGGKLIERPADDRLFDDERAAKTELRIAKALVA